MKRTLIGLLVICAVVTGCSSDADAKVRKPHSGPTRVVLMGDSLTGGYQTTPGYAGRVGQLLGAGYQTVTEATAGTGLLDANVCSAQRAKQIVAADDPDVVVVEFTGNFGPSSVTGQSLCTGAVYASKAWQKAWLKSARATEKALRARGARVIWVEVPMPNTAYRAAVPGINATALRVSKGDVVDAWTPFGGTTYNAALHTSGGIHLNDAGTEKIAQLVAAKIR